MTGCSLSQTPPRQALIWLTTRLFPRPPQTPATRHLLLHAARQISDFAGWTQERMETLALELEDLDDVAQ